MSDAVNKQPTLDEQISTFKGYSVTDGEIDTPSVKAKVADDDGEAGDAPLTAAERLAQLDGTPKPAKAAKDDADAADDEAEGTGEDESDDAPAQPKAKPKQNDAQKRIAQAVGRQRAAERERDALNARLSALEARMNAPLTPQGRDGNVQTTNVDQSAPPDPQSYQYGELDSKYISDLARFETIKAINEEHGRRANAQREQQANAARAETKEKFQNFEAEGLARYDDFDVVVTESATRGEWALSPLLASLIIDSDHGPDIAYHLAGNKAEAKKVFDMTPAQQAAWFGRREAVLSSETQGAGRNPASRVSRAPAAPARVARGSGSRQPASADTSDFASFERMAQGKH
jgi:hypothetical protein